MRRLLFSRIAIQLGLAASALLVCVLAMVGAVLVRAERRVLLQEMQVRCDLLARDLSIIAHEAIFPTPDIILLTYLAETQLKEKWILGIDLYGRDGKVILSKSKAAEAASDDIIQERPILLQDGTTVGQVRMKFSTAPVRRAVAEAESRIALIALGSVVGGLLIITAGVPFMVRPIRDLAAAAHEVGKGNFDVHVVSKSHNEIGSLARSFNRMVTGLKEREFIRATFGRYVNPHVAEAALKGKVVLGGESKPVSILLCDIRKFTTLSEGLTPEAVVAFLNEYFSAMVRPIQKHDGVVDKFIGDAILAVFGAPAALSDHAAAAAHAALDMRAALAAYNRERAAAGRPPIGMGIAINSGEALAGNIGTQEKTEYTVIGDVVNVVSRLEEFNKEFHTEIIVSESTRGLLGDRFQFKPLGQRKVRGREAPLELFELLG